MGLALLLAAAILGGVLEGITRISWERLVLAKRLPFPSVLNKLTPENIDLYERGVQSSYKWVTFYANAATALLVLSGGLWYRGGALRWGTPIALLVAGVLFRASYVQWTYFGNYSEGLLQGGKIRCCQMIRLQAHALAKTETGDGANLSARAAR